ncbi:hypothetical protein [Adhaeribacter soli]|uniref:Uncharacterized protein n=1 Tax=Adhaeribacter soli TaxID=2607655 RepID=A0A5N1J136_9BACT|nr:hypothetical protein [Adhaeribacter soli]KAA9338799.1 hypothetical protein F0P94_08360 [Adhaeribacter soli]
MKSTFLPDLEFTTVLEYVQFFERLQEPLFTLKDAGLVSKLFQDWQKAGLWYQPYAPGEKRQWTRLNLEEYTWLKFIQQLRQLGASTEIILSVKEYLFASLDLGAYLNEPKYKTLALEEIEKSSLPKESKEIITGLVKSDEFTKQLDAMGLRISRLFVMLFSSMIRHQETGVFVFPEGEVLMWADEVLTIDADAIELYHRSHIYLSISQQFVSFLLEPEKEKFISPLQLLSNEERMVLNAMRDKTLKKIKIKLKGRDKSGKAKYTLITTKDGKMSLEDYRRVAGSLVSKNYESIVAKNINGTEVYFERERRRML